MSNRPHIRPTGEPIAADLPLDPSNLPAELTLAEIDELEALNMARRNTLQRRGSRLDVSELLLMSILEALGDEARELYHRKLSAVLDEIDAHQRRAALLARPS